MSTHQGRNGAPASELLLIIDGETASLDVLRRHHRARDRIAAHLRAYSLDAQLAAGRSPDQDRLHAIRADVLVAPRYRRALARHWEKLIATSSRRRWDPRFPLSSPHIARAETDIRTLVYALRNSSPVPARGVALASMLLADGTGPLYNGRTGHSLEDALREAVRYLDPTTTLLPS